MKKLFKLSIALWIIASLGCTKNDNSIPAAYVTPPVTPPPASFSIVGIWIISGTDVSVNFRKDSSYKILSRAKSGSAGMYSLNTQKTVLLLTDSILHDVWYDSTIILGVTSFVSYEIGHTTAADNIFHRHTKIEGQTFLKQ